MPFRLVRLSQRLNISNLSSSDYSLALNRLDNSDLGYISFGGLPPVAMTKTSVSLPITPIHTGTDTSAYTFYSVPVDGFSVAPTGSGSTILDPGSAWLVLKSDYAKAYHARFSTAGTRFGQFLLVDCKAAPPPLSVTLGGETFEIDARDLIVPFTEQQCASAVMDGGEQTQFLGDPFLRNAVLSFNVLEGSVVITQREKY